MHIVEFAAGTLRFLEAVPEKAPADGFVWIYLERESLRNHLGTLRHQIRHQNLDRAVFLLINAIPSVIRAAVETDPEGKNDRMLATELTDMTLRYLVYVPSAAVTACKAGCDGLVVGNACTRTSAIG